MREQIARALLAAGSIGTILAVRGTFAAEVAGCQVEIGASGAMAAAAVVDAVGGSALQACDAAAISFQNTMGTVCDLLHGIVEIPCHTRNGAAAAAPSSMQTWCWAVIRISFRWTRPSMPFMRLGSPCRPNFAVHRKEDLPSHRRLGPCNPAVAAPDVLAANELRKQGARSGPLRCP